MHVSFGFFVCSDAGKDKPDKEKVDEPMDIDERGDMAAVVMSAQGESK